MSLQPMALFDELTRPGVRVYGPASDRESIPVTEGFVQELKESRRVQVSDSVAMQAPVAEGALLHADSLGPLRLPFSSMWIEWTDMQPDEDAPPGFRPRKAIQCREIKPGSEDPSYVIESYFSWEHDGQISMKHLPQVGGNPPVRVDFRAGELVGFSAFDRAADEYIVDKFDRDCAVSDIWIGLTAIGLMNCKNVTTEHHERPVRQGKKSRRIRPPKLDYHTIVLPGQRNSSSGTGTSSDIMPQHVARGHFKTFTAERPLMGQHVGTYWWGWQVRGSKKNGITVTDYKVGAA